jgi:predicted lactoylglutathione lyase
MLKKAWINLPVKDPKKSVVFFKHLGFSEAPQFGDCVVIGDVIVMLFSDTDFQQSAMHAVADTKQGTEVLITIEAENNDDVDDLVEKVEAAGGTVFSKPQNIQGWMYGAGFADLDGHRWNVLYLGG